MNHDTDPTMNLNPITETLERYVRNDNDAPRLIAEAVFPILGIDLTLQEAREGQHTIEGYDIARAELEEAQNILRKTEDEAEKLRAALCEVIEDLKRAENPELDHIIDRAQEVLQ